MDYNFIELINKLNENLYIGCYNKGLSYNYFTNGFVDIISFGDYQLYNSEFDSSSSVEECRGFGKFYKNENSLLQKDDKYFIESGIY